MSFAEFLKDYGAPIAWIVAAIGWGISNHQANTREKRKEFRTEIDAIEKVSKDILTKFASYFKLQSRDESAITLELEIKVLFRELDFKWERISKRLHVDESGPYSKKCKKALEQYFDFATGRYFETSNRPPQDKIGFHLHEIHVHSLIFIESLHSLFLQKFDNVVDAA
jgi:hypothetical protein